MKEPETPALSDGNAERARKRHVECIRELQRAPLVAATVIKDVRLKDGVATQIAHGLGRVPIWIAPSAPRGASSTGRIDDVSRDGGVNRQTHVSLKASGFGATITVDVAVS